MDEDMNNVIPVDFRQEKVTVIDTPSMQCTLDMVHTTLMAAALLEDGMWAEEAAMIGSVIAQMQEDGYGA